MLRAGVIVAAVAVALVMAACGSDQSQLQNMPPELVDSQAQLANPADFSDYTRSSSAMQLLLLGREYDTALPFARVSPSGDNLLFQPQETGRGIRGLSYAGYSIAASGYSAPMDFQFNWALAPPAGKAWLALIDFETLQYDWYAIPSSGLLQLGPYDPRYFNSEGFCIGTLLLRGTNECSLASLRLGYNQLPEPVLVPSANPVAPGTAMQLDASGSSDIDGSIVRWEFDPLGNGSFTDSLGAEVLDYIYADPGVYNPALRVTDNEGAQASVSIELTVQEGGSGMVPAFTVTPGSANPGETVVFDASMSLDSAGTIVKYEFDPEGDGSYVDNGTDPVLVYSYSDGGEIYASLRITDDKANFASLSKLVHIGWTRTLKNSPASYLMPYSLVMDAAGNIYVCGEGMNLAGPSSAGDGYLCKYSPDGELLWQKLFTSSGNQMLADLALDSQGNLYAAGYSRWSPEDFPMLDLLRINPLSGNPVWRRQWLGLYQPRVELLIDSTDQLTLMVEEIQGLGETNVIVLNMDTDAVPGWEAIWQSPLDIRISGAAVDDSGNIYGAGSINGDFDDDGFVWSLTKDGGSRWAHQFDSGGPDDLRQICLGAGQLYAAGKRKPGAAERGLLLSIGSDGALSWAADYSHAADSNFDEFHGVTPYQGGVALWGTASAAGNLSDALALLVSSSGDLLREQTYSSGSQAAGIGGILDGGDGALYLSGLSQFHSGAFSTPSGTWTLLEAPDYDYLVYDGGASKWDAESFAADSDIVDWNGWVENDGGIVLMRRFEP
ncbi:hypothetical protein IT575_12805 [bacterium]|nr:hypothetical protein [bacterium]